jgi:transaldolase
MVKMYTNLSALGLPTVSGDENYVARIANFELNIDEAKKLRDTAKYLGVTEGFKKVIDYFKTPAGETPPGFEIRFFLDGGNAARADLVRNISFDRNGKKRPTGLLFSADSANPYEVAPIRNMLANLTCNPGIIYDLFLNDPRANVNNEFKTRDEVMNEIGRILGPGADISVELNDPFRKSDAEILEEAAKFREMLSEYRVVIKVPHTGPVNGDNVSELLRGDKRFSLSYREASTKDALRGHNLALMLHENGFRVNFTLMFEPYQTALALQARPYFINSFIRHRLIQTKTMDRLLKDFALDASPSHLEELRNFMLKNDYYSRNEGNTELQAVKARAEEIVAYRQFTSGEGFDGLDGVRHNLRLLRDCNMENTYLIICSMEGESNYPDIDRLLASPEFIDMAPRVIITAEPNYLARFTSTNQVVSYLRRFMNAAEGAV